MTPKTRNTERRTILYPKKPMEDISLIMTNIRGVQTALDAQAVIALMTFARFGAAITFASALAAIFAGVADE